MSKFSVGKYFEMFTSTVHTIAICVIIVSAILVALSEARSHLRIVGGRETNVFRHPYMVSLRYKDCPTCAYVHECGGIIYSTNVILTAAHCVYKRSAKSLRVIAGTNNRAGNDGLMMPIEKILVHEKYNSSTYENNIALLMLDLELPLNPISSVPIKIAERMPSIGAMATVSGWGHLSEDVGDEEEEEGQDEKNLPDKLQEVEVYIVRQKDCIEKYGQDRIKPSSLCAGFPGGGRDACTSDSGGPLINDGKLIGIVSWSIGCARPDYPGVYTNVITLRQWIQKHAGVQKPGQFLKIFNEKSNSVMN